MNVANSGTVELEINGNNYTASYTVWKDVVNLEYQGKTKSTQVGGLSPDAVARMLLREIIENE